MRLLQEISGLRGVVFDLDGTLYQDGAALPGAREVVDRLRAAGVEVGFLTNTTSKSRRAVADKMRRLGFAVTDAEVFSPPFAAGAFLRREDASAIACALREAHAMWTRGARSQPAKDFFVDFDRMQITRSLAALLS